MRRNALLLTLLSSLLFLIACQKEYSLELSGTRSSGSLQKDPATGECLPKTVEGVFEAGTPIDGTKNYIDVEVNVSSLGTYRVYSDTVNGIYFDAKGSFTSTGLTTVRVPGNGTPTNAGIQNFVIAYDTTKCVVSVTTLPAGTAVDAVYSLAGAPATCTDFTVAGNYIRGIPLSAANTVSVKVNVTSIGTYDISTGESNGVTFSGSGVFTATGEQTVTLAGSGTPAVANTATPFGIEGTSSCGFTVNVTEGAVYTIDCATADVNGVFEQGKALTTSNTIELIADVTTPGPYSINVTANGMTFAGAGNFPGAGPDQVIILNGTGTPTSPGDIDFQVDGACAFSVTVVPGAAASDLRWKFTAGGVTYEGDTDGVITLPLGGTESSSISGESDDGNLTFALALTKAAPMSPATFSTAALPPANVATMMVLDGAGTMPFSAVGPPAPGITVVLATYNETTKIAEGTFSGTAKTASGGSVVITAGTFKATIL